REVARGSRVPGGPQAPCPPRAPTGVVACAWTPTFTVQTATSWVPGVYLIKLERDDGFQRYVPFFVRDPDAGAEVVAVIPTATWAAYNTWGGTSLYYDRHRITTSGRAYQVSYDKPFVAGNGAGHLITDDVHMVSWLEAQGLEVAFVTDEEMDRDGAVLSRAKALFLSGHDEYWTKAQRDRADRALADGVSILNLGANNAYWQIRLEPSADGRPRRVVTCYKADAPRKDPVGPTSPELTVKFRDLAVPRPENALFGVMFASRWHNFAFPTVMTAPPGHWALAGTGLKPGDTLWQANGYELDRQVDNGFTPAGIEVLAQSPGLSFQGAFGYGQMVLRAQGNAWVFSAGGVDFVRLLSSEKVADPRAGRLVANVLYRALGRAVPSTGVAFGPPPLSAAQGPFSPSVSTVAGKAGQSGTQDGPAQTARLGAPIAVAALPAGGWAVADALTSSLRRVNADGSIQTLLTGLNGALGVAADRAGNVYVSDTDASCVRRIAPDGTASVLAGTPWNAGSADGFGPAARFVQPAGLTVAPDGALWVADLGSGAIRRIDLTAPDAPVSTLATNVLLRRPSAVAVAANGTVYAAEADAIRVVSIRAGQVSALTARGPGFADGPAGSAQVMPYVGLALLADGSLVVADPGNYRLRRITFSASGESLAVHTLAGSGKYGNRDGVGDQADLVLPAGLGVGSDGTVYVAESGNARIRAVRLP
ncbi:MAG TPA: N,N-dimethylformamidase beta subunit family domain-containing protein, partial [Myxococcaceae bacterium]|nr:N,N-dimethylformamidase beta subunit family domain-containing protein [Myxococcaceae bacterium]